MTFFIATERDLQNSDQGFASGPVLSNLYIKTGHHSPRRLGCPKLIMHKISGIGHFLCVPRDKEARGLCCTS